MCPRPWQAFSGDRIPVQQLRLLCERLQGAALGASIRDLLSGAVPWVPRSRQKNGPKSRALFLPAFFPRWPGSRSFPLPSPPLSKKIFAALHGDVQKRGQFRPFLGGFFLREGNPAPKARFRWKGACRPCLPPPPRRQPQQAPASLPLMQGLPAAAWILSALPGSPPGTRRGGAEDRGAEKPAAAGQAVPERTGAGWSDLPAGASGGGIPPGKGRKGRKRQGKNRKILILQIHPTKSDRILWRRRV